MFAGGHVKPPAACYSVLRRARKCFYIAANDLDYMTADIQNAVFGAPITEKVWINAFGEWGRYDGKKL
jgi:hypothetical protein